MSPLPALADLTGVANRRLPVEPAPPDAPAGRRVVFLLDASTGLEDRLLRAWIDRLPAPEEPDVVSLAPSRIRRAGRRTDPRLDAILHARDDPWLIPLRVIWMPGERGGRRTVSWVDVLKLGDPRDPRWFRDYVILGLFPDRVQIVVGGGAGTGQLRADHDASVEYGELIDFVTRRAWRALDRAEREQRGDRYKIPKFVAEDIVNRPRFRDDVVHRGRERGLNETQALARARYYLREIAATHSPYVIDLLATFIHWVYSQGYSALRYDRDTVEQIAQLGRDHSIAFLPSHRSNLDRLALQFMLWENDMPPNHTAGGINMNFLPFGPLLRRTGVFFIRRSFKDNELYKYVVKTYLDYLIEKRFPLEWYMEGGRSRSGKLRPPRFGMLSWVVQSLREGITDDVYLIPMSIAYDQIQDVDDYAHEAAGAGKEKESFSWALRFIRSLRLRYGDIHMRFAEPISIAKEIQGEDVDSDDHLAVQKLAFEVMYRISEATPITPTAVVSIVLLDAKGQARSADAIAERCTELIDFIERNDLPTTTELRLSTPGEVERVIAAMQEHGLVSTHTSGMRTVYWMTPDQGLRASYYRNMVVHFFVPQGLAEVALSAPDLESFWSDLLDLRDLLKFEFFFAEKEEFRALVAERLDVERPGWETEVEAGRGAEVRLVPSTSSWTVLPLLEAYMIVADELAESGDDVHDDPLLERCLERGHVYRLEGRIASDESVSTVLFGGAIRLAANRGLTDTDDPGPRRRFADEIRHYVERASF